MPRGGASARAARRPVAPWWEELDSEAFREFPAARRPRITSPAEAEAEPEPVWQAVAPARRAQAPSTIAPAAAAGARQMRDAAKPAREGARPARDAAKPTPDGAKPGRDGAGPARDGVTYAIDGRRTVTIRGYGAEAKLPMARPALKRHERPGFRPDRTALWAVLLGMLLILVAAASAHAAVVYQLPH
jgi:hypothetical protein